MLQLIERAQSNLGQTAVLSAGKTYTYRNLLDESAALAQVLLEGKSDLDEAAIAFMIDPGFGYVKTQWAIWRAGGMAVPLCNFHPLPSLRYVLEDTGARNLLISPRYEALLKDTADELGITLTVLGESHTAKQESVLPEIDVMRRAMILYTSGTTNLPKGVVSTHKNLESQITTLVKAWHWQKDDHILCILPLHHVHGIVNVSLCALWSGAKVEYLPKFDAEAVFGLFGKGELNLFMAVPTIYFKLIDYYEKQDEAWQAAMTETLKQFRLMVSGSAALPISVLEKWRIISGHTLLERYGMTEIGMAVSNPYDGERRPGHIGRPLPGVELRIVDEDEVVVPEGSQGEIQIKGPNVFLEYWQKPAPTAEAFTEDGWFRTGDIALWNDGSIRILGRNSVDIIKSGGYKISALEIEEIMRTHPDIKDCGVVGVPDDEWGEIVCASLVLTKETIDETALKAWLKERMPAYRVPRRYVIQSDLPRNVLGKVTKKEIVKLF